MNRPISIFGFLALLLVEACAGGGGGTPTPTPPPPNVWATSLAYVDPGGTGCRLLKNAALSTPTRLVLDVVGPTGQTGQGVSFILRVDGAKASWVNPPASAGLVQSLAFNPGSGPAALVGKDKGGGELQGAVFQKTGSLALGQPLARVCLELKANSVAANSSIGFAFNSGNALSDSGTVTTLSMATGQLSGQ